jgi:hypothetical protein
MQDDLQAIVLPSGKGIRFCDLTPKQLDDVLLAAAKSMPVEGTIAELTLVEAKFGLEVMLQEITKGQCAMVDVLIDELDADKKPTGKRIPSGEKVFNVNDPSNVWEKFDPDHYDRHITSGRDHSVLKAMYHVRSKSNPMEIHAILGKAVPVAR